MKDYYEIIIPVSEQSVKDIIIAQLAEAGYEGFEEETDQLKAFIAQSEFSAETIESLLSNFNLTFSRNLVKHTNWNKEWEEGFAPVRVGDFCAVRAVFHDPVPGTAYEVIITPKMSFGTGHHATTYLMIETMSQLEIKGKSVLDFGTGTGLLAVLAEKMGASAIEAIDNDVWSIENGKENLAQNGCRLVNLHLGGSLDGMGQYDVILANINKNVILENIPVIKEHLVTGGTILFSGLLTADLPDIELGLLQIRCEITHYAEKNGWICLVVNRIEDAVHH